MNSRRRMKLRDRIGQIQHKVFFHGSFYQALHISLIFRFRRQAFRFLEAWSLHRFIAVWCLRQVRLANPQLSPVSQKINCLALCPERFRGDLEVLEGTGKYQVCRFPTKALYSLNSIFLLNPEDPGGNYSKADYFHSKPGSTFDLQYQRVYRLFKRIVPAITAKLKINLVLMPNFTMPHFECFGIVAREIGIAFVALHREGLMSAEGAVERDFLWAKWAGHFRGTGMIVHTELQREALVRAGYIHADRIVAAGCLRMDQYLRDLKNHEKTQPTTESTKESTGKSIVLFSFSPGTGLVGMQGFEHVSNFPQDRTTGFWRLFHEVHKAFIEAASMVPDSKFVIKTKWGANWFDEVSAIRDQVLEGRDLPNLTVTDAGNAHEMILRADVVTSFGSTTLLEAVIADKPVILPMFAEASEKEYEKFVFFRRETEVFDVAYSEAEYLEKICHSLKSENPTEEKKRERRLELFDKYLSNPDGQATQRYHRALETFIELEKSTKDRNRTSKLF